MAVVSLLIIDPTRLSSLEALRAEAERVGDPIEFLADTNLESHTGYLPLRA